MKLKILSSILILNLAVLPVVVNAEEDAVSLGRQI